MTKPRLPSLDVAKFGQIDNIHIEFGDLTVLVGPQATGKSIALQLWKLVCDGPEIVATLRDNAFVFDTPADFLDLLLGEGLGAALGSDTRIGHDGTRLDLELLLRGRKRQEAEVFFIPAHRALVLNDGWPRQFQQFSPDTPFVVRQFSDQIHQLMSTQRAQALFPEAGRFKHHLRNLVDHAVFHGMTLRVGRTGSRRQLKIGTGGGDLSFMSWSAGQREFVPLLLGLYHLLPGAGAATRAPIRWVIIEEPEMGLHPQAIRAVMLLGLELVHRGYRVVLSTHAPLVLDIVWALRNLQACHGTRADVLDMFDVPKPRLGDVLKLAERALAAEYRAFYFDYGEEGRVTARDISSLDPGDPEEAIAGWGGLTGLSGAIGNVVARAVARSEGAVEAVE